MEMKYSQATLLSVDKNQLFSDGTRLVDDPSRCPNVYLLYSLSFR